MRCTALPTERSLPSDTAQVHSQARHCGFEIFPVNDAVVTDFETELNDAGLVRPGIEFRQSSATKDQKEVAN